MDAVLDRLHQADERRRAHQEVSKNPDARADLVRRRWHPVGLTLEQGSRPDANAWVLGCADGRVGAE